MIIEWMMVTITQLQMRAPSMASKIGSGKKILITHVHVIGLSIHNQILADEQNSSRLRTASHRTAC